jgi:anaphase-promoting complex subunit 7
MPGGVSVVSNVETGPWPLSSPPPDDQVSLTVKELYDVEASRECRAVRERITELDLVVKNVIPAAPNSLVFSDSNDRFALPIGTKIPRMVVTRNVGEDVVLSGEAAILDYLRQSFAMTVGSDSAAEEAGDSQRQTVKVLRMLGSYLPGVLRAGRGARVCGAAKRVRPDLPRVLYSYEGNQFCRLVR